MIRVGIISPEPTPYRAPLFDRIAANPDIDLTVIYAARTVAAREWRIELGHRAIFLDGPTLPTSRLLHHVYPITPGLLPLLERERFTCLVVAGWSLFASQAAVVWARLRGVPYILMSESHLLDPRPVWKRAAKRALLPHVVAHASGWLVTGSLAREAIVSYGADAARVRLFANTVDAAAFAARVDEVRARAQRTDEEVVVLSTARLDRVKGLDVLIRAAARVPRVKLVLVGSGPQEAELRALAAELGVRTEFGGFVDAPDIPAVYATADVFALLSRSEPWGVAVVEAAAAGLPLLLSTRVGAASDLLRPGENGEQVPPDDIDAAADALARLASDAELRARYGACSQALAKPWDYEMSVDNFVAAVREAVA
jgi:glycosyltransferase involved in cell wall biosynthesis